MLATKVNSSLPTICCQLRRLRIRRRLTGSRLLRLFLLVPVASLLFRTPASAQTFILYDITMNHRVVDGKQNGVFYEMDAGYFEGLGKIETVSKDPGANATPVPIKIELMRRDALADSTICESVVTPPSLVGFVHEYYDADCVYSFADDDFYIFVSKLGEDDGWNIRVNGSYTSSPSPSPK